MRPLFCVVFLGSLQAASTVTAEEPQRKPALIIGTLHKDHAYAVVWKPGSKGSLRLLHAQLPDGPPKETIEFGDTDMKTPYWRIAHDHLWVIGRQVEMPFWNEGYFRLSLAELVERGKVRPLPTPSDDIGESPFYPYALVSGGPVHHLWVASRVASFKVVGYYDYLPTSATTMRLFLLCNTDSRTETIRPEDKDKEVKSSGDITRPKWTFRTAEYTAKSVRDKARDRFAWGEGNWSADTEMEVAFTEPFHAFQVEGWTYFVTASGKLYVAYFEDKSPHKVEAVWTDPQRPVTHVAAYGDQRAPFLFGTLPREPGDSEDRLFCFPLSNRPRPEILAPGALRTIQADEPLKGILQFADVLARREAVAKAAEVLKNDTRLKPELRVVEGKPWAEFLDQFPNWTQVPLSVDPALSAFQPRLKESSERAYRVLLDIARDGLEDGRWIKHGEGYRLTARRVLSPTPEKLKESPQRTREPEPTGSMPADWPTADTGSWPYGLLAAGVGTVLVLAVGVRLSFKKKAGAKTNPTCK